MLAAEPWVEVLNSTCAKGEIQVDGASAVYFVRRVEGDNLLDIDDDGITIGEFARVSQLPRVIRVTIEKTEQILTNVRRVRLATQVPVGALKKLLDGGRTAGTHLDRTKGDAVEITYLSESPIAFAELTEDLLQDSVVISSAGEPADNILCRLVRLYSLIRQKNF